MSEPVLTKYKLHKQLEERAGIRSVYKVSMEESGLKLYISRECRTEMIVGWCTTRISKGAKPHRAPLYMRNGKLTPHILEEGDCVLHE